ncbi:zinc-dependent alcohol dehydrogenase family protein [Lentzea sp. NPDC060358]|uniref:zinc-dependent alcohol dehydrogenase family protein n=1 Tax=Lentzea sp. NPDC060358 TaxID=3347103 RepID=UPI00364F482B
MRATLIYGAEDIRVEEVPDPVLRETTDALVRVVRACVCGSDLWPYKSRDATEHGDRIGHEFVGVVEEVGSEVGTVRPGDLVIAPFLWSDGTCDRCRAGWQSSCRHGGGWGAPGVDGGQGEAVRVPQADGTLVKVPGPVDEALLPSLLTLSDVFSTGHHAAVRARVEKGSAVVVIGDGAVGLCAVLAAKRLGAEQVVLLGRHTERTDLGREFGATDVVAERGEEAVAAVRKLTGGDGAAHVLECVGMEDAFDTALGVVSPGGVVSRVGVPQYERVPFGGKTFMANLTLTGGVAPARAYIPELLPDVLEGRVQPGRVFDRTVPLDEVPGAYRAMNERKALKVMIRP